MNALVILSGVVTAFPLAYISYMDFYCKLWILM